jgi:hypothetical protein
MKRVQLEVALNDLLFIIAPCGWPDAGLAILKVPKVIIEFV